MNQKVNYRVLLIDDQETIHEDYRKVLGVQALSTVALSKAAADLFDDAPAPIVDWEGFELDSALQGQDGFALVQKSIEEGRPYAVAFVDIRMPPGWDGIQTIRRIWEVDPEILIVICSAYSDYSWEDMVRQLGRNDRFLILKKPFDNVEVRQCAMALTERWSVSRTDVLTGLINRRAFVGHLQLEWSRAARHQLPLACAMIDLDYFKRVNDTLGHQAGDQVLQQVAHRLQTNCRVNDYVCRHGGEEFCILLPHTSEEGAATWAEHARHAVGSAPIVVGERMLQVTASIGVAERMEHNDTYEALVDRADQALLIAKKLGRNRVVRFSSMGDSNQSARQELRTQANLFQGLTARQVMSTPVASLKDTSTAGEAAEFFLRFRVNSAPIVDDEGKLIGILSEKDVIGVLLVQDAWTMPIERIMQRSVVCYEEDAPVQSICEFLSRVAIRRVVIVRDGRPSGVVSRGSLLRWYSNRVRLQGSTGDAEPMGADQSHRHSRLAQAAEAVARSAAEFSTNVANHTGEITAAMIEGVSRLQESVHGLLDASPTRTGTPIPAAALVVPVAPLVASPAGVN